MKNKNYIRSLNYHRNEAIKNFDLTISNKISDNEYYVALEKLEYHRNCAAKIRDKKRILTKNEKSKILSNVRKSIKGWW